MKLLAKQDKITKDENDENVSHLVLFHFYIVNNDCQHSSSRVIQQCQVQ